MVLTEYIDCTRHLQLENDITDSHIRVDMATMTTNDLRIRKSLGMILSLLISMGINQEEILSTFSKVVEETMNHPDNEGYEVNSAIEEQVNNDKERDEFINNIKETEDIEILKDVYRSWLYFHSEDDIES